VSARTPVRRVRARRPPGRITRMRSNQPPRKRPSAWWSGSPATRFTLSRLAPVACTCARAVVESTDACQDSLPCASVAPISADSIRSHIPSTCQQANSAYTRHYGPYRSGTSRHGHPTRVRYRAPSTKPRSGYRRGRPRPVGGGSNGTNTAHWASVRS
jgi:hypothetical protein